MERRSGRSRRPRSNEKNIKNKGVATAAGSAGFVAAKPGHDQSCIHHQHAHATIDREREKRKRRTQSQRRHAPQYDTSERESQLERPGTKNSHRLRSKVPTFYYAHFGHFEKKNILLFCDKLFCDVLSPSMVMFFS